MASLGDGDWGRGFRPPMLIDSSESAVTSGPQALARRAGRSWDRLLEIPPVEARKP